ncbi:MAG: RNA polymerase sigma factor [Deltaproteobacteria bacterium]|nr:RNA polymerase sigma factor [Deltaproteobacteria bacterium]
MNEQFQQTTSAEQQLVKEAFAGDSAAFGKLVVMYQTPVYSACMRYLGGEDARDAAQEVFMKAFIHREQFVQQRAVLPWLMTIARNLCIDRLRRRRPETTIEQSTEPRSSYASAEEQIATKQSLAMVNEQMARLPSGQREAIVLHHVEGLAYKEIAEVLDIPEGTVMTWLHRGRKTLQNALKQLT